MAMIQATYNKYAQGACLTKYACMVWRVPHLARNPLLFVKESLLFGFSSMNQILLFGRNELSFVRDRPNPTWTSQVTDENHSPALVPKGEVVCVDALDMHTFRLL